MGLFAYWAPNDVQKLWKDLSKKGLKTSGDYGIVGLGIYNGQGINVRNDANDDISYVLHTTYPIELNFLGSFFKGQVVELGADALIGKFNQPGTATATAPFAGLTGITSAGSGNNIREERIAAHAILFPQPFGLQAEWTWGNAGTLNADPDGNRATTLGRIERQGLSGGYVQAMYKIDNVLRKDDAIIPYAKWQTYDGVWKAAANSPRIQTNEIEAGVEWQLMKALEVTLAYSTMDRTNAANLRQASGDMIRTQVQWNY
jgi:hypothetical protein